LIIIGGGVSKNHQEYFPYLKTRAQLVPAQLLNQAGIVGAALYAYERHHAVTESFDDSAVRQSS
jgi:polyphosphate glucokinase